MSFDIERIDKSARRVSKFLRKNPKRPGTEAIHDLRTETRRLETTFATLGLDSKSKVQRLLAGLKDVRKRAGKVRDMDVLTGDALTVKPNGEQDCLVQLLEHLGAERNKFAKKLRLVIEASNPQLRRSLERNTQRVEKVLLAAEENPADSDAMPITMAKAIQLASDLNTPARLSRNNLHAYRLKVKELRNVLQLSDQADHQEFMRKLTEVKDAIGEWHDWEELIAIATGLLDHGASCKLIKRLREISNAKYERALSITSQLRGHYLKRATLSTSVLRAASSIAQP